MQKSLEVWGGAECTVNRIGGSYFDQLARTGHDRRLDDLDRFAALGLTAFRQAVLWERTERGPGIWDWRWADQRLGRLRQLGMRPIVGLVHHGGGPQHTGLTEESFATGLAEFAAAAAERFPWVDDWTPVNEPLTTARFSCLYGHWHPHRTSERDFWLALLNQVDAIRLSMRAIRRVNPRAKLIQTEDLGRTYATRALSDQADYNNARRWMTWDLLCGLVTTGHPFWRRLSAYGFEERLRRLADEPCPPDVIGVNHYLTSDRFLDERAERYRGVTAGGEGAWRYVDVEALRVLARQPGGVKGAMRECWDRYGRPIALTECHNGCTREEQIRWLRDSWAAAIALRDEGCRIEAVTAWSLLGAYDWNSLLTREDGHYEPGAFDVSGGTPRETALGGAIRALSDDAPMHPAASGPGWWARPIRLTFPPVADDGRDARRRPDDAPPSRRQPLLIVGAGGEVATILARACEQRGLECSWADDQTWRDVLGQEASPWAVMAFGPPRKALLRMCHDRGLPLFTCSADGPVAEAYRWRPEPRRPGRKAFAAPGDALDWLIDRSSPEPRRGLDQTVLSTREITAGVKPVRRRAVAAANVVEAFGDAVGL